MFDSKGRNIHYLRLSVTDLCNLRCRYCMPEEGVCKKSHADMLTEDEMIQAIEAAASLGITKLRITGGDPDNKIHRLLDFTTEPRDIADPWYTGDFETTFQDILEGCEAMLSSRLSK